MPEKEGTELEIAQSFIVDKNNNLTEASKILGISLPRLYFYRSEPEKLQTAAWINVHKIARYAKNAGHKSKSDR